MNFVWNHLELYEIVPLKKKETHRWNEEEEEEKVPFFYLNKTN